MSNGQTVAAMVLTVALLPLLVRVVAMVGDWCDQRFWKGPQ